MRRTQELEEMITQQNKTIMGMLSGGKGKEEKSQVNLSVDFITGKNYIFISNKSHVNFHYSFQLCKRNLFSSLLMSNLRSEQT
jgi:hypothetical protein